MARRAAAKRWGKEVGELQISDSYYLWKIRNFSKIHLDVGEAICSPEFETSKFCPRGLRWRLRLYPAGTLPDDASGADVSNYVAIYLMLMSDHQVWLRHTVNLVSVYGASLYMLQPPDGYVFDGNNDWGHLRFFPKDILTQEKFNFLRGDTLIISCTIEEVHTVAICDENLSFAQHVTYYFKTLLVNAEFSDCTFHVGTEKLKLHRVVVASQSAVFRRMLLASSDGKQDSVVTIVDFPYQVIKELVRYIYTRVIQDYEDILDELFEAAHRYEVHGLKLLCEKLLFKKMNESNAISYLELAVKNNAPYLVANATEFIARRLADFIKRPELMAMNDQCKNELLKLISYKLNGVYSSMTG
ncbi:speckle-type POZ protein-like [Phymastichus coffea]|uniref:speckle-type POZ protein-like n=1 Tax=Phymastichus coffea TaxID=108790 RepID=UPI00273AEAAA|nr:speckle-type POZ protein-like [Phymastichus coffea]